MAIASIGFCSLPIPEKPPKWDNWNFDRKMWWRRNNPDPRIPYHLLVDKLKSKEIMKQYFKTAEIYYATDDPQTLPVDQLPRNYIMKANNASGRGVLVRNGKIIARHKRDISFVPIAATENNLRSFAETWLNDPFSSKYGEKQYDFVKPMILFEEYLENLTMDIELFCFYGKVQIIELLFIRNYKKGPVISFYDSEWNLIKTDHKKHPVKNVAISKPEWLDKLIAITEELTQNIDQIRVDYYLCAGEICFGEFTFTTGESVIPDRLQKRMGDYWSFPENNETMANFGQLGTVSEALNLGN